TISGLLLLLPDGAETELPGGGPTTNAAAGTTDTEAEITAVDATECEAGESDPVVRADCISFTAEADGEEGSLYVTPDAIKAGIGVGDTSRSSTSPTHRIGPRWAPTSSSSTS